MLIINHVLVARLLFDIPCAVQIHNFKITACILQLAYSYIYSCDYSTARGNKKYTSGQLRHTREQRRLREPILGASRQRGMAGSERIQTRALLGYRESQRHDERQQRRQ